MSDQPVDMYELLDVLESVIKAAPDAKREELAAALDAYAEDFPEEFDWAVGAQSPMLLHLLMNCIGAACHPGKSRSVVRLVDRKPEGTA